MITRLGWAQKPGQMTITSWMVKRTLVEKKTNPCTTVLIRKWAPRSTQAHARGGCWKGKCLVSVAVIEFYIWVTREGQKYSVRRHVAAIRKSLRLEPFHTEIPSTRGPKVPSCPPGGGRVQGWESVCRGVGRFPQLKISNQSFNVSNSESFEVPKRRSFKSS